MIQPDKKLSTEITLPGVAKTFYPTHESDGKEIVYYCLWCEAQPVVRNDQVAVSFTHNACYQKHLAEVIAADNTGFTSWLVNG